MELKDLFADVDQDTAPDLWARAVQTASANQPIAATRRHRPAFAPVFVLVVAIAIMAVPLWLLAPLTRHQGKRPAAAASPPVPTVLSITCTQDGQTLIDSPEVAPQPDGYHFHVNIQDASTFIAFTFPAGRGYGGFGMGKYVVNYDTVWSDQPASYRVTCGSENVEPKPQDPILGLVDPEQLWHSGTLSCQGVGEQHLIDSQPAQVTDVPWDQTVRAAFMGLEPSDVIEYAGFPSGDVYSEGTRIVRAGAVVAWLRSPPPRPVEPQSRLFGALDGRACDSSGIVNRGR